MDAAGATAASVISLTHTKDLLGMRTSHLPSSTYTHDVYSADLKLSGLGQRLGVNIGPLRWLLLSVTYGAKGYRVNPRSNTSGNSASNSVPTSADLKRPRSEAEHVVGLFASSGR